MILFCDHSQAKLIYGLGHQRDALALPRTQRRTSDPSKAQTRVPAASEVAASAEVHRHVVDNADWKVIVQTVSFHQTDHSHLTNPQLGTFTM